MILYTAERINEQSLTSWSFDYFCRFEHETFSESRTERASH
jgi:hypothetical protein